MELLQYKYHDAYVIQASSTDIGMSWRKFRVRAKQLPPERYCNYVMARTGSEYHSIGGDFSAAKGELRKLNVTAGMGGKSYLAYQKVPARLAAFCEELNRRRKAIDPADVAAVYDLSFWTHFELVTIHPWADGNGRTCRLLMNLLQWEFDVLPTKVIKEDKAEYIQALIDTRESENLNVFLNCMTRHHCQHLQTDIDQFIKSTNEKVVDKQDLKQKMVDKALFGRENGRYLGIRGR